MSVVITLVIVILEQADRRDMGGYGKMSIAYEASVCYNLVQTTQLNIKLIFNTNVWRWHWIRIT